MSASGGAQSQAPASKTAPYAPTTAQLGGVPTIQLDGPICAVLMAIYVAGAITNMAIFQVNRRRDHKFLFSVLLFGFCISRILTLAVRIIWASKPREVPVAIAASILVQAGVLLLFVINLIFAQRLVRSYHPETGWSKRLSGIFKILYICIVGSLIMVIVVSVYTFYTLDNRARQKCRLVQLVAGTFLAFVAFLPIPITALAVLKPRQQRPEKFGQGRYRTKISLLLITSFLLTIGAAFRIAVAFTTPRPLADPAWYHSKPCFYCFNFVIEILVVYLYAISRFDRRFHIPNGASAPGHYSGSRMMEDAYANYVKDSRRPSDSSSVTLNINREIDVFGDDGDEWNAALESDWEARAIEELNRVSRLEPAFFFK